MFYIQYWVIPKHNRFKNIVKGVLIYAAFSFLWVVRLNGKLLKIFMPVWKAISRKHGRLAFGLRSWCLFHVLIL